MNVLAVLRPAAGRLLLAVLAGAGAAGAAVGLMATSAWLISRAALHPPVLHLMVAIVTVRAFGISRGVLRYLERLIGHDAAFRILGALRVRLYSRLERLAPAGLADFRRADLVQRLVTDVDAVLDLVTRVLLPYAVATVVGLGAVLLVGSMLPVAGITLAVALLVVAVGVPVVQSRAARRADGRLAPLRGELATATVDLLHGLPDLTAFGAVDRQLARIAGADAGLRRAGERSALATGLSAAVTALSTGLCLIAGLAAGAVAVRAGTLSGELLAVVVLTPLAVFEIAGTLPAAAQHFAAARAALRRLGEVLAAPVPVPEVADPEPVPDGPGTLTLAHVTAGWAPGRTAVRDFSMTLPAGSRTALVGPSGSGKSTIAALLVRFLDPAAGRVTLDGTDLRRLDPAAIRRIVTYLPEDAYLFDTTIAENLRIGRRDATDDELRAALARARLLDWAATLPKGLDTLVGEHGVALSGGQRRRLALARALLTEARVLILDEPTEHLDDETAHALTTDLLSAAEDRTVLLITHRTDDLGAVDRIVTLTQNPAAAPVAVPSA
ncbi:thiol reductant ABC exporter subunit CydC [Pseudosporangium ferrugineum]|uniref:ATP-binding cassette subfamily C protein CydC n=1 Tax=Pseudosporangium ferrugineum TaxID=439699 RepID=A0A2T0SHM3_9ACTN|nr:thiol reductant ABC exporter subunit CydC [Pseudosporangium ferrugineum]PRY32909.1 ATP-binding cassette subfamily C protein CydC [Pseudosporangium ferrugineum]